MSPKLFPCQVLTPQGLIFQGEVSAVIAPASSGEITILSHHEKLFTSLADGLLVVRKVHDEEEYFAIESGYLQTNGKEINILIAAAIGAKDLNEKEILSAQNAASNDLKNAPSELDRTQALQLLRRSSINLKVLQKYRQKKSIN